MNKQGFERITNKLSASVPLPTTKEYIGEDGFPYCSICNKRTQTEVEFLGIKRRVRCVCGCKTDFDDFINRQKQEAIERQRKICFQDAKAKDKDKVNMGSWTFENDDRKTPRITNAMKKYVENFEHFRKDGKGLLLYGPVGTGKSYAAACIANALIDKDYRVLMTNFPHITNTLQGMFDGKQDYIDSLNSYTLLIIDDLGIERNSEFMQEMIFNVIDARYRSGLPFIVTTNLTAEEIKKPQDVGKARIYDRIMERCIPVEISEINRRRQKVKDNVLKDKALLGL